MLARNRPILHWYVLSVVAFSSAMLLSVSWAVPQEGRAFGSAVAAFLILGIVAEAGFIRVGVSSASTSVAFLAHLAAVVLFPPAWNMLIAGGTMLVVDAGIRKKPAIKALHNTGKEVLAIGLASMCYAAIGGAPSLTDFDPSAPGFVAAIIVYFTLSHAATATALALSGGKTFQHAWRSLVGGNSLLYDYVAGPVALLLAFLYLKLDLVGLLLVIAPLFLVRHVYQMALRLETINAELLQLMVKAIEARDPYTSGHSLRVSKFARAMAQDLGLSTKRVERIATAALLHDVGKIYEEFAPLLRKEGKLTPSEYQLMQSHPAKSAELVGTISAMRGSVELAVRHHHESFNGCGYPDGLKGEDIPIGSRIIAVADTVDAMTTDRPYRKALPYERVTQELQAFRGKQFDPALVDLFCSSLRIQALVNTQLRPYGEAPPKTVADTFDSLRQALGHIPGSIAAAGGSRWQKRPTSRPRSTRDDLPDDPTPEVRSAS